MFQLAEADAGYGNSSDADARLLRILPSCFPQHGGGDRRVLTTQRDAHSAYLPKKKESAKRTARRDFAPTIPKFRP